MAEKATVKLCSSDHEIFDVDKAVAEMSVTVKNMIEGTENRASSVCWSGLRGLTS